jgi:hypothetical protein
MSRLHAVTMAGPSGLVVGARRLRAYPEPMPDLPLIRIGTRSSPMALAQAEHERIRAELAAPA